MKLTREEVLATLLLLIGFTLWACWKYLRLLTP